MKLPNHQFLIVALFWILSSLSSYSQSASSQPLRVKLQLISKGFTSPVGMACANDGSNRLFVIEQGGKIKIIKNGQLLQTPFLNISKKLVGLNIAYSEKGLLGLAFHPKYKTNGRFFVYYSAPYEDKKYDHQSVIAEYRVSATNAD